MERFYIFDVGRWANKPVLDVAGYDTDGEAMAALRASGKPGYVCRKCTPEQFAEWNARNRWRIENGEAMAVEPTRCADCDRIRCICFDECEDCGNPLDQCDCEADDDADECLDCGELVENCACDEDQDAAPVPVQGNLLEAAQAYDREETDRKRAEFAGSPELQAMAVARFRSLIAEFDALMRRGGNIEQVTEEFEKRADSLACEMQGGSQMGILVPDGPASILEALAAAPDGEVPLWGQSGSFVALVGAVRVRFEVRGLYGVSGPFSFSIHAVDFDKPFPSHTGYRSFAGARCYSVPPNYTIENFCVQMTGEYIASEFKGRKKMGYVDADHRPEPVAEPVAELPEFVLLPPSSHAGEQLSLFAA